MTLRMIPSCEEANRVSRVLFLLSFARFSFANCIPVTHKIYGIPQTINSANYVYFLAYQELFALRSAGTSTPPRQPLDALVTGDCFPPIAFGEVVVLITRHPAELLSLHRGQGLEILWRDSLQCPSEEEYIAMVNNSTRLIPCHDIKPC